MDCRVNISASGYTHHEMIQLREEFRRSLLGSFYGDVQALQYAYTAYSERKMVADTVPSPELRYERALDSAHRDAFQNSGIEKHCPLQVEVRFF